MHWITDDNIPEMPFPYCFYVRIEDNTKKIRVYDIHTSYLTN